MELRDARRARSPSRPTECGGPALAPHGVTRTRSADVLEAARPPAPTIAHGERFPPTGCGSTCSVWHGIGSIVEPSRDSLQGHAGCTRRNASSRQFAIGVGRAVGLTDDKATAAGARGGPCWARKQGAHHDGGDRREHDTRRRYAEHPHRSLLHHRRLSSDNPIRIRGLGTLRGAGVKRQRCWASRARSQSGIRGRHPSVSSLAPAISCASLRRLARSDDECAYNRCR